MVVKPFLTEQLITDCLCTHYGIKVSILTLLPLGADMNASVYKAQTGDGSCYFIKLKQGHHHDISIALIELLHHAGIQQIIPPVKTIDGQLIQLIDDFTLVVYPFIEGENGFNCTLTDKQWLTLGETLRKIHEIDVPLKIQHQIRRETYSSKWRDRVRSLYPYLEVEPIDDEMTRKLWTFMRENMQLIHRLVDRAEGLADVVQNTSSKFVLCHADIHGGNVLIDKNNTLYIVDWDDPMMAPKERDLMFIGGGVANVWNKSHEEILFYEGYGKTEIDKTMLSYYRYERIVEDIALYGQDLLLTDTGGADRAEMYEHFIAMFEPNGVIEIAFKSAK